MLHFTLYLIIAQPTFPEKIKVKNLCSEKKSIYSFSIRCYIFINIALQKGNNIMNRKSLFVLLGLVAAVSLTACGNNSSKVETGAATEAVTEAKAADTEAIEDSDTADEAGDEAADTEAGDEASADDETASDDAGDEAAADDADEAVLVDGDEEESESEQPLEPVTPSDYLVKDVDQYVKLGDLEGIEITKYTYEITDDMVQERIDYDLDTCSEEVEVDRAAAANDIVYLDLTSSVQGSDEEPYVESTYFNIGMEDYGPEFDEQLIGAKTGDHLEFSISFDSDIWIEEWADQTVDFTADITGVSELIVPEYNEEYLAEYTDYTTKDEYEEAIREALVSEYEEISYSDAIDALLEEAVARSEFSSYPQELYDSCKDELLSFYAAFAGTTDEDEIYELFGITEDDIREEIEASVNRRLLVSAICAENDLTMTQEEYFAYLEENAPYYEYESAADFENDYTRETLIWSLYESMAADLLYGSAEVTEEVYTDELYYEDDFSGEDLSEEGDIIEVELDADEDSGDEETDTEIAVIEE